MSKWISVLDKLPKKGKLVRLKGFDYNADPIITTGKYWCGTTFETIHSVADIHFWKPATKLQIKNLLKRYKDF